MWNLVPTDSLSALTGLALVTDCVLLDTVYDQIMAVRARTPAHVLWSLVVYIAKGVIIDPIPIAYGVEAGSTRQLREDGNCSTSTCEVHGGIESFGMYKALSA
jgi:hypothetical protein